jgi:YD repeat-containing protein
LLSATELGVVNDAWTYNTFGEPTNYTAKASGSDAYSATFTRDALGRITTKNETVGATSHLYVYTYDASGRLTTVQKDGATAATYTYDDNGNRTKKVASGVTTNGTYDAQDRLLTYGGTTYTYTPNGELKTKVNASGTTTYTYDVAGNLRNVVLPDGKSIEYLIDGQNRRTGKKVNGVLTQGFLIQQPTANRCRTGRNRRSRIPLRLRRPIQRPQFHGEGGNNLPNHLPTTWVPQAGRELCRRKHSPKTGLRRVRQCPD